MKENNADRLGGLLDFVGVFKETSSADLVGKFEVTRRLFVGLSWIGLVLRLMRNKMVAK